MNTKLGIAAAAAVAILLPLAVTAATGIRNSRHDLSASSGTAGPKSATNTQLCIFCHTPHKAMSTTLLWNHTLTSQNPTWQDATKTSKGTPLPTTLNVGTKRCLSCHDGSTAIGDVGNAGNGAAGIIAVTGTDVDSVGKLTNANFQIGASGNLSGTHPVGIAYPGSTGNYYGNVTGVSNAAAGGYYPSINTGCANAGLFCTTAAAADGADGSKVKIFQDTGTGGGIGIECGSCHDTHNQYGNPNLTVVDNTNASGLCRSCHNK
jgi:predicted CXXCH cytochrome family protein